MSSISISNLLSFFSRSHLSQPFLPPFLSGNISRSFFSLSLSRFLCPTALTSILLSTPITHYLGPCFLRLCEIECNFSSRALWWEPNGRSLIFCLRKKNRIASCIWTLLFFPLLLSSSLCSLTPCVFFLHCRLMIDPACALPHWNKQQKLCLLGCVKGLSLKWSRQQRRRTWFYKVQHVPGLTCSFVDPVTTLLLTNQIWRASL